MSIIENLKHLKSNIMNEDKLKKLIRLYKEDEKRLRYAGQCMIDDNATIVCTEKANIYVRIISELEDVLNEKNSAQDKVCIACDIRQAVTGWHNSFCVECWEIME